MKRSFKFYAIIWFVFLSVFNIACFVSPAKVGERSKFGGAFWVGYIFITVAFLCQLACAYKAFDSKTSDKLFLNIPLISVSYATLIIMSVFGIVCMAIPNLPNWIGIIACFVVLAFGIISVVSAYSAAETVSKTDYKIKNKTAFIKLLTADSEELISKAQSDEIKREVKRVYEEIRYSDPISDITLNSIEAELSLKFGEFSAAVKRDDGNNIKALADEVCDLIGSRNAKCKILKR